MANPPSWSNVLFQVDFAYSVAETANALGLTLNAGSVSTADVGAYGLNISFAVPANGATSAQKDIVVETTANAIGTGDFTIEAWVKLGVDTGNDLIIVSQGVVEGAPYYDLRAKNGTSSSVVAHWGNSGASFLKTLSAAATFSRNTWTHICVMRSGGTAYLFTNGVVDATTLVDSTTVSGSASKHVICGSFSPSANVNGIRVCKEAVYSTAGFTPPSVPFSENQTLIAQPAFRTSRQALVQPIVNHIIASNR